MSTRQGTWTHSFLLMEEPRAAGYDAGDADTTSGDDAAAAPEEHNEVGVQPKGMKRPTL
jgi:hypothetical protein